MAARTREDRRLRLLSATCLALPEAERTECGAHADFRVRGKIFAYFLKNHGGDGIIAACFKARLGEHIEHVRREPDRFYLPRFLGRRGWVGMRLDRGEVSWDDVAALVLISYNLVAPKGLRMAPTNALTGRTLVKGTPSAILGGNETPGSAAQLMDGNLVDPQQSPAGGAHPPRTLRPTTVSQAANVKASGGFRGRR